MDSKFPIIQSVIDNSENGTTIPFSGGSIVQHRSGFCQIMANNTAALEEITKIIADKIKEPYLHFYDVSGEWMKNIMDQNPDWNIRLRKRISGVHNTALKTKTLPNGYKMQDVSDLNDLQLQQIPNKLYHAFYSSVSDFKTNSHAKIIWAEDGRFAAMCYAAAFGEGVGEIDVHTEEHHRNKGLGEGAVIAFIKSLQDEGKTARWDCFLDNFGSITLAKKCGFELGQEYWFLSIYKIQ